MHGLWNQGVLIALVVFVVALLQGRSFGVALRMGVGVLIVALAAIVVLTLTGIVLNLALSLLWIVVWVAIVYGLIVVATRALKGTP